MTHMRLYGAALAAGILLLPAAVSAHHAITGFYDPQKTVMLTGTVTRFDWGNPHTFIYLDVKDDNGATANWALEGNGPGRLSRTGWSKTTLKPGDVVSVEAWLPRQNVDVAGTLQGLPRASDRLKTSRLAHARDIHLNGAKLAFGR